MDPYKVLGVSADVDQAGIEKAFRKLSLRHHPDKANIASKPSGPETDAERQLREKKNNDIYTEIINARELLSDHEKRQKYDEEHMQFEKSAEEPQFERSKERRDPHTPDPHHHASSRHRYSHHDSHGGKHSKSAHSSDRRRKSAADEERYESYRGTPSRKSRRSHSRVPHDHSHSHTSNIPRFSHAGDRPFTFEPGFSTYDYYAFRDARQHGHAFRHHGEPSYSQSFHTSSSRYQYQPSPHAAHERAETGTSSHQSRRSEYVKRKIGEGINKLEIECRRLEAVDSEADRTQVTINEIRDSILDSVYGDVSRVLERIRVRNLGGYRILDHARDQLRGLVDVSMPADLKYEVQQDIFDLAWRHGHEFVDKAELVMAEIGETIDGVFFSCRRRRHELLLHVVFLMEGYPKAPRV